MWRPPQRIRFAASAGRVPTAAEAAASRLFSPIDVGPVSLDAAHLGSRHGAVAGDRGRLRHRGGDRLVRAFCAWNARRDRGRGDRYPRRAERPAAAHRSRPLPAGLSRLVETVRRASEGRTRLFIQLIDFLAIRRRPEPEQILRAVSRRSPTGIAPRWRPACPTPISAPACAP